MIPNGQFLAAHKYAWIILCVSVAFFGQFLGHVRTTCEIGLIPVRGADLGFDISAQEFPDSPDSR